MDNSTFAKKQVMIRAKLKEEEQHSIKQIQVFHSYFKNNNKFIKMTEWKETESKTLKSTLNER